MTSNRIVIGQTEAPLYEFDNADVREITQAVAVDIIGAELSSDRFTPKVGYDKDAAELWTPSDYGGVLSSDGYLWATNKTFDDIRTLPYGTVIRYYHDGELAGKFYTKNVDRIAKEVYQINAMSAVGILDAQQHNGGVYTGQTFEAIAAEIIGGAVPFTCDAAVARQKIFGWLPIATKRRNLHQLLFATGAALKKDANGDVRFVFLSGGAPTPVPNSRIFMGGNVDYSSPASAVEVTEHAFYSLETDETVTLYDNTDGSEAANYTFISFEDAPIHGLTADGNLTIQQSGANYAIVSGVGTLSGKKYTHITRAVAKEAENHTGEENVVTVTDATLVSIVNSQNVAKRVLSYYSSKKTVRASVVLDGETVGQQLEFSDPYGEESSGFLASMEINVSSNLKAECTIITDYVPTAQGNNYSESYQYTGSGWLTVPETGARAILIGGGDGGSSGGDGFPGEIVQDPHAGNGGDGGQRGEGGPGGKILAITLSPGRYYYSCGAGGEGGIPSGTTPVPGSSGGATTISQNNVVLYSSANGASNEYGYTDLIKGTSYARPGRPGVEGGYGGQPYDGGYPAGNVSYGGSTWYGGANGDSGYPSGSVLYVGGGGGGAAVGSNGTDGGHGTQKNIAGGKGGDAPRAMTAEGYGNGGYGGFGGGGGGGGGYTYSSGYGWQNGSPGAGGSGGIGGKGASGIVILVL